MKHMILRMSTIHLHVHHIFAVNFYFQVLVVNAHVCSDLKEFSDQVWLIFGFLFMETINIV